MPNIHRLKSSLQTPKNMISTKNGYNALSKTGRTIQNTNFSSSVDITLYDNDTDDNTLTKSTESRKDSDLNAETFNFADIPHTHTKRNKKEVETYNPSDTITSSIGYHTDDEFYDDIDEVRANSYANDDKNKVKCNCRKWLNEYKKCLICTTLLIIITAICQNTVDRNKMGTGFVYLEFIGMIVILWNLIRIIWGLISYWLFICTARHWCNHGFFKLNKFLFYIHHSGTYICYSLLSTILYVIFIYIQEDSNNELVRFTAIIEHANPGKIEFIERVFLCSMVLWYGLFIKTVAIRWACLTYYLSSHLIKIKKFKKYESWLKILLRERKIFSIKVKTFLDINELHNRNNSANFEHIDKTIAFTLSVLANADPNELRALNSDNTNRNLLGIPVSKVSAAHNMDRIDEVFDGFNTHDDDDDDDHDDLNNSINNKLVNTLTSGSMFNLVSHKKHSHNSDTCLLWLYNASTQQVSIIDDNDLDKICKKFAKYIVSKITKKRFDAKTPHGNIDRARPSFTAIQSLFKTMTTSQSDPTTHPNAGEKLNTNRNGNKAPSLKRSSMTVSGEFIQQSEFIRRFTQVNQTRKGHEAWKDINMSDKILTKKELQRWLYQFFHDLIYLKQKLNSYQDILNNLDMSTNIIAIFVLFFIFLLIFEINFIDSVSIYFSMIAIFAVFGKNVFTQFFDAIYFIFVLSPFEIGDVVLIDDIRYTVLKLHIMSTEMITAVPNGNTIIIKNNAKLLEKDIKNLSRTKAPYHNISFYISQLTSISELNTLKLKIDTFIKTKMQNDINEVWFILDGVDRECRMRISLFLGSIYPFTKSKLMWKQYHLINVEIKKIVSQMGIQYKRFSTQDIQLSALIEDKQMKQKQHLNKKFI